LLWAIDRPELLDDEARSAITDGANDVFASAASAWEIAIKRALGKLEMAADLSSTISEAGLTPLAITVQHALHAGDLPRHHEDPFDRVLVAQAALERLTLVTRDSKLNAYDVEILRA